MDKIGIDRPLLTCLKQTVDKSPFALCWKDRQGHYQGCNQQALVMLKLSSYENIIGKTSYEIMTKELADIAVAVDEQVIATGQEYTAEERRCNGYGTEVTYLVRKIPLRDQQGEVMGVVEISFTLAEQQQQLQQIEQMQLDAMQALADVMAHELRTPLAGISLGANGLNNYLPILLKGYQLAKQHGLLEESIRKDHLAMLSESLDSIARQAKSANMFIDMALMNVKHKQISKQDLLRLSMRATLEEALMKYPFQADEKELLDCTGFNDFTYEGNAAFTLYMLFNFIKNALYYIHAARKGKVAIYSEVNADYNVLCIKDTGQGIAPEVVPHIFKRFFTTKETGVGVGLSFCQAVMHTYGGQLYCESELGQYTEFKLLFPKAQVASTPVAAS